MYMISNDYYKYNRRMSRSAGASEDSSRELAVSGHVLGSFEPGRPKIRRGCFFDGDFMLSGGQIQAVHRTSCVVVRQSHSTDLNGDARSTALGPRNVRPSPSTLLLRAWRNLVELRIDEALASIAEFGDVVAHADGPVAPQSQEFAGILRAILLVLTSHDGATVQPALAVLEKRHRSTGKSSALVAMLRIGYWKLRDFDQYYAVPRCKHAVAAHRGTHGLATIIGATFEAIVEAEQLRLAVATRLARNSHERGLIRFGKRSPVTACAAMVLAELLYEEGQCTGLETLVMDSLATVRISGDGETALRGYRVLARIAARRKDTEFAFLILREAEVLAAGRSWTTMLAQIWLLRTQLLLMEGRSRDAALCAQRIEALARDHASSMDDTLRSSYALAHAQVLVAAGEARRAATILRQLQAACCGKRNNYWALQLSVHLADALLACGDHAEGRVMLIQSLQVGARAGVYQTFVDAGAHVAELMLSFHHVTAHDNRLPTELRPYIGSILEDRAQSNLGASSIRASRVTESLSPREHSILRLMSCGLSNKRVAQELQIAPETVKSHVKGIFIKLGVQTRAHAVSTASALGIL
jgi:LuxR family transcriptional regulator, maltose regulon positive regulatory protein